jgi:uncharacterized membrane protein YfcA
MDSQTLLLLLLAFALVAALYSTVGHAGASGYLAVMALMGVVPEVMRPTALVLNLVVASVGTYRYSRAGLTSWRALLPLVLGSMPLAFVGGSIKLPVVGYRALLGIVLLASAVVLAWRAYSSKPANIDEGPIRLPFILALLIGAAIGLLSGLTGTGGGIFLSPLLLLAGWAGPRRTSGIAAPFILINSASGLTGLGWSAARFPAELPWLALAVLLGGYAGTQLGVHRLPAQALLGLLTVVLTIAGTKLLMT